MIRKLFYILRTLRWSYFLSWYVYFLGYFVAGGSTAPGQLWRLCLVFVALGPVFYSGVYYLNDIFDRLLDRQDAKKRNRPVASGAISVPAAYLIAAGFIFEGVLILLLLQKEFIFWLLVLLAVNLFYTLLAKKIAYLELIINVLPHPLRFYLGNLMAGSTGPHPFILTVTVLTVGLALLRRLVQMDGGGHVSRPTLLSYQKSRFVFLSRAIWLILIFLTFRETATQRFGLALVIFYSLCLMAYNFSDRAYLKRLAVLVA